MSNSNNIYNILGKLAALAPKEVKQEPTQKIYESVEAKGSVLEGVGAVEARLLKEFNDMQEKAPPGAKAERMVKGIKKSLSKDGHLSDKDKAIAYATTWKAHNAGQVEEGEETCVECGMNEAECSCVHEGETEKTKHGIKHKGSYGTEYQGDTDDEEEEQRKFDKGERKRGRPSKGGAKKAKPTGEKKGKGRPKKSDSEKSQAHLPWGGKPPKVDLNPTKKWPKEKTRVHTMKEAMSKLEQRFQQISEGVNFAELLKEKHQSVDEMLAQLSDDIKLFKDTGHCSELLRDCMEIKGYHGKMVADEAAKAPVGIPGNLPPSQVPGKTELLNPPKPGVVGAAKDIAKGLKNFITGKPETGPTYEEVTMEDELNELARLAGLSTEGNAFTGKLASTPKGGKFELDGKEFTDTSTLDEEPNEGNAFSGAVAKAKADGVQPGEKITVGGKEYPVKEEDVSVDEPSEEDIQNDPNEKYGTIKQITTQGDDMNRQKRQDPATANRAANPFTNDVMALESQLASEYESIKKVSK